MNCGACNAPAPPGGRFCSQCGESLPGAACPRCSAVVQHAQRFCAECGAPLEAGQPTTLPAPARQEGARKQVTVLFCDIVGSTRLAEQVGAEAMHVLLARFFELALAEVHRYGGTIDKFLGDGFLALVGVPVAHEDHARRAVLAALGIRRRLQEELGADADGEPIRTRMGLNTGLVVVGSVGDQLASDFTAIGDTINVASRLEALARPGDIVISDSTARLVSGYVRTEPLGDLKLPGKSSLVQGYRVVGVGSRRSRLQGRRAAQFVGRERQLAALNDLLGEARQGRGQVVGVVGEPGMGKTRLVAEFRRDLTEDRPTILEGRCLSYGSAIPWVPVRDIVRADCRISDADRLGEATQKVRQSLARLGLASPDAEHAILHMLGLRQETDALAHLSPEAIKARTLETLLQMSLNGSRRRTLVFVVEDLHWVNRVSEEFFSLLVENLQGAGIMLLCTYRPGYAAPWMQRSYATQLALPRLAPSDALTVVSSVLGSQGLVTELAEALVARAEGNPFFLEELARTWRHRDEPDAIGERVPETIQDVLAARVNRLSDDSRRVLQTASVLGRQFPLHLLRAVWDGNSDLGPHLEELKRLEFIHEAIGTEETVYVFKHALTQDVAYDGLLTSRRQALHQAAGEALEAVYSDRMDAVLDQLAHHYSRTTCSDKAVEYLDRFAARSVRTYAHSEATKALREALVHVEMLEDAGRDRRTVDLVMRLVNSLYFLGRFGESLDLLLHQQPTVERIDDPEVSGPFHMWLGHTYTHAGDSEGAARAISRATADAHLIDDLATTGKSEYVLSREGFWMGRLADGAEHGRRAVAALRHTDEWWWLAHAHCWTALNLCNLGRFREALAEVGEAERIGDERGDPRIHSYSHWNRCWFLATRGDWEEAIAAGAESLQTSPDTLNSSYSMGWLGFAHREKGDYEQAIRYLDQSIALLTEFRYSRLVAWFKGWLAEAHLWRGDIDGALETADQALRVARELRYPWGIALARRALGRIALGRGAVAEAEGHLGASLAALEEMGARFDAACVLLSLAEASGRRGDATLAEVRRDEALTRFRELDTPRYVAAGRAAQGLLRPCADGTGHEHVAPPPGGPPSTD